MVTRPLFAADLRPPPESLSLVSAQPLKDSELEALLREVRESNEKLLEIIETKERQNGGGGQQH